MARSVPWRRACPECVELGAEQALRATIYILNQTGPTGLVLKEEGSRRKLKVFLGDPHTCTCSVFKKDKELCIHILWVLLKRFRVPRENPVSFQLGLVEREINEVLQGYLRRQQPTNPDQSIPRTGSHASQKEVGPHDVCPICQDELLGRPQPLTYCKFGCGKSVHVKCMKIWAEHQKSNGERTIKCPLCREDFGRIEDLRKELHSTASRRLHTERLSLHLGVTCNHCHTCPVAGQCYRCTMCASYHLCQSCFNSNQYHVVHSFKFRKHPSQPWRPAVRTYVQSTQANPNSPRLPTLPPSLVDSLQSRSLTESDYELLLQLDNQTDSGEMRPRARPDQSQTQALPDWVINSFHVEPVDSSSDLLQNGGAVCELCNLSYSRGDWVRKLPCKHKFHRDCIDHWLRSGHSTCPIDEQPLSIRREKRPLLSRRALPSGSAPSSTRAARRIVGHLTHAMSNGRGRGSEEEATMQLTLSGQSIGSANVSDQSSQKTLKSRRSSLPRHRAKAISILGKHTSPSSPCTSTPVLLPKIPPTWPSAVSTVEVCSRRNVVENTKRMSKQRKSLSPSEGSESITDGLSRPGGGARLPLEPICNGYSHTTSSQESTHGVERRERGLAREPLPPLHGVAGSPPYQGRLRRGSLVSSMVGTGSRTDSDMRLDCSLCVSRFKLRPLTTTSSVVMASSQL